MFGYNANAARPPRRRRRLLVLAFAVCAAWAPWRRVAAGEIRGTVQSVSGNAAKILIEAPGTPAPGDRVVFYQVLPEVQEEASVATGRVSRFTGTTVWAAVDRATATVTPGQRARIISASPPRATASPSAARTPSGASTPKPGAAAPPILRDDFEGPTARAVPQVGPASMSFTNLNGEGVLTGATTGVLSAVYPEPVKDFIAEFSLRIPTVTDDSGYGLVFRGTPALDGKADYDMLLVQPSRQTIALNCWHAGQWAAAKETPLKAGSFIPERANQLRIAVLGAHIRVFLNKSLACEFDDDTVSGPGALGLCIVSMSTAPGAAYFDNLVVKDTRPGAAKSPPAAVAAGTAAPGPVWMGISLEDEFASKPDSQGLIRPLGVRIVGLWPGEPADRAGLKQADIITKIGGKPVANLRDYDRCLAGKAPGEQMRVVFLRGNERRQARVRVVATPPDSETDPKLPALAQKGEAWAQVELGDVYHEGRGVARDEAQAVAWYYKAAVQGDTEGQTNLGDSYLDGQGVAQRVAGLPLVQIGGRQGLRSSPGGARKLVCRRHRSQGKRRPGCQVVSQGGRPWERPGTP